MLFRSPIDRATELQNYRATGVPGAPRVPGAPERMSLRRTAPPEPHGGKYLICSQKSPTFPTKSPHRVTSARKATTAPKDAASTARSRTEPLIACPPPFHPPDIHNYVRVLFRCQEAFMKGGGSV